MKSNILPLEAILAAALFLTISGCETTAPPPRGTVPVNELSTADVKAGWRMLFDGKSLNGWRSYGKGAPPAKGWVVEDGILKCVAHGGGGDIITLEQFTDYDFRWEWRLPPKANNGVKYMVTESRPSAPGPEYQMIDDAVEADSPLHSTASFYEILPPAKNKPLKPVGEWNHSRIVVKGKHVEHWLNDVKVLGFELGSPEVMAGVAKSKFKNQPGFGQKIRGHILLTYHQDEAWFRNLKIRELPGS